MPKSLYYIISKPLTCLCIKYL